LNLFRRTRPVQTAAVAVNVPLEKLKIRKSQIEQQRPEWINVETPSEPIEAEKSSPSEPVQTQSSEYMTRLKEAKKRR
jgi:hypothetical protein